MSGDEEEGESSSRWSRDQDKMFEIGLATYSEDDPGRWDKIAADIAGKSVDEIKHHYEILVDDVAQIESGCVPIPSYINENENENEDSSPEASEDGKKKATSHLNTESKARSDQERRKGIAWTEDEHRLFLLGLDKYGKGDWRSISRNFVVTRTPTQVASHAQKYFIRLNSMNKDRRRSSIHDITSTGNVDNSSSAAADGPITGGASNASAAAKSAKQPHYVGPTMPAVGTPVVAQPQMAYGLPAPPMPYHMPHR